MLRKPKKRCTAAPPAAVAKMRFSSRWWGCLPLVFFLLKLWQYLPPGNTWQLLWFCNLSNLILGLAIFLKVRDLVFTCATILTIGLPVWIFDFIVNGDFHPFSILTHVLSPAIGFAVSREWGRSARVLWQVPVFYLLLQLVARVFTPPGENINVAFAVYAPVRSVLPNFYIYSAVNLAGLTAFGWVMHRLIPGAQKQ